MGKMAKDDLGNRMKGYEYTSRTYLPKRLPVVLRIDGKAFHTFTRGFAKPFDKVLMEAMWETTKFLCSSIQGCKVGYTQSDEISLLLVNYEKMTTDAWFGNNIQKMVSVSASMATLAFNKAFREGVQKYKSEMYAVGGPDYMSEEFNKLLETYESKIDTALFDSRVWAMPKEEVNNYFVWRQGDCSKNSIQMVARANFSHNCLQGLNSNQLQEKMFQESQINWSLLPTYEKRGICVVKNKVILNNAENTVRNKWEVDKDIPVFTQDTSYIERFVL